MSENGNYTAEQLAITEPNVALIFEGGGMRASYTAAVVAKLIEEGINFGKVYGISAGSSHTVNYVSRDIPRAEASFTTLIQDPQHGGWKSMLMGKGFFNGPYLYEGLIDGLAGKNELFSFDWDAFSANPADVHIEAFDGDTGETIAWTKADMPNAHELAVRVRASSTMPLFMQPPTIDDRVLFDGGLGTSWGIPLHAAMEDGYEKFFIVRTQPRAYRKGPISSSVAALFKTAFRSRPLVAQRTIERPIHYNALVDEIDAMARSGQAYVFYPETMPVTNRTEDIELLMQALEAGQAQAERELPKWEHWLAQQR